MRELNVSLKQEIRAVVQSIHSCLLEFYIVFKNKNLSRESQAYLLFCMDRKHVFLLAEVTHDFKANIRTQIL